MALLATVVRKALRSIKDPSPKDVAAAELAIHYAKAIDNAPDETTPALAKVLAEVAELDIDVHDQLVQVLRGQRTKVLASLGPKLLTAMEALLITPRARAALQKGVKDAADRRPNPLDDLRSRRAARVDNTPPVDPSAP